MNENGAPTPLPRQTGPVARPRDAASLLLLRDGRNGAPEVLMGRRAKRSRFMPDVYVFPGGRVDSGDGRARPTTDLRAENIAQMAVANRAGRGRALAMAAVRETFEETGLIVGRRGDPGRPTPEWAEFARTGFAPSLDALHYVGRAITPTFVRIRFHARFFVARADAAHGELQGNGELMDLEWVPLSPPGDLHLADVTRFIMTHVRGLLETAPDAPVGKAFFTYRNRGRLIRFDGGPPPPRWSRSHYEAAAGPL